MVINLLFRYFVYLSFLNLKANSQNIYEDWVWVKGQGVSVNYDIINRKGQKLSPTSIVIKDNRTWKMTTLNIAECIDQNGIKE